MSHPYRSPPTEQLRRSRLPRVLPFLAQHGEWLAPLLLVALFLLGLAGGRGCH